MGYKRNASQTPPARTPRNRQQASLQNELQILRHMVQTDSGNCLARSARNVNDFKIIDTTLREGEQFATAYFNTATKVKIARALDDFGVHYIELTSPAASEKSKLDCETICRLGLKTSKILTHIRCTMSDARIAVETGVHGVNIVIGTSSFLRQHSHGKDMITIQNQALEVVEFVKSKGLEVRFSTEDSFRSNLTDILPLYSAMDKVGVDRIGIADTVGCASPRVVHALVSVVRKIVSCDIEVHMHNDTGCAIANAYCAVEAGATHVDTTVLGIGERNGITSLGGLMARMMTVNRGALKSNYNLTKLKELELLVAGASKIDIPFNNCITGFSAFTHKAGIHTKAILANPKTYEILDPQDFGLDRHISLASRLTGWNAIKFRATEQLKLEMTDEQYKEAAAIVKAEADKRALEMEDVDNILVTYHRDCGVKRMITADSGMLTPPEEKKESEWDESICGNGGRKL